MDIVTKSAGEGEDIPDAYETEVRVNSLVWITSLRDSEKGVTDRILEDLEPHLNRLGIGFTRFEPRSRDELYAFLDMLREKAVSSFRPIIHLDMHGHAQDGLKVAASGENAPWPHMVELFREINIAMNNCLCVISLACFGFHILKDLDFKKPTPFYALVGSDREIAAGDIEERAMRFYKRVFEAQDLATACEEVWQDSPRLWLAEKYLFEILVNYVLQTTRGQFLRTRRERALTFARTQGLPASEMKAYRRWVRENLRPNARLIDKYGRRFFIDRPVNFTLKEVKDAADLFEKKLKRTRRRPGHEPYFMFNRH
ncbi:hypothetical protein D4A92_12895 [Rhizobium rosettiformans]|uniref:Uncharacterized protein n=1 Tax=Rhizobium rosettiformans TaxID=1368430 RepID=A0ABX7EWM6_9HYPH|nr:hypothetical protein [Rhizobium rosettiformans]QRF52268.1 hypothetical protein D4A92_12895 [Rhizobium rosettiformans]